MQMYCINLIKLFGHPLAEGHEKPEIANQIQVFFWPSAKRWSFYFLSAFFSHKRGLGRCDAFQCKSASFRATFWEN